MKQSMPERIRASYARLEARGDVEVAPKPPKPPAMCRLCGLEPKWHLGKCTTCLAAEARSITVARKREARERKRLAFFHAKRAARLAGDLELRSEIEVRRKRGCAEPLPKDTGPDAKWRMKHRTLRQELTCTKQSEPA